MADNIEETEVVRDPFSNKLSEIYDQISGHEDIAMKLASFLTTDHYFNYGLRIANEITGRQGKNRATIDYQTTQLMRYSFDEDIDELLDTRLNQLLIDILNTYLADKQELPPNKPKIAAGMLSRVKALVIMLVATNQLDIIKAIKLPRYILSKVTDLFIELDSIKDDATDSFITWLEQHGNYEMAEIVKQNRNEFWGSEGVKANSNYDKWFHDIQDRIKDPIETYNVYLEFRAQYRKSTKNILPSIIYDIMDITPDAYNKARLNVYNEINELFPEDENSKLIQKLLLE